MPEQERRAVDGAADLVLQLVGASDDALDEVVNEVLGAIAVQGDAERGYVTFYDTAAGTFDISHEWTRGVVPHRAAIQDVALAHFPWSVGIAVRQQVLVVDSIEDLPPEAGPERESFGAFGVHSIVQVPIVVNGATVGIAGLNRFRPGTRWDDDLVEYLGRAGQAVGIALLRRRAALQVAAERAQAEAARTSRDELLAHVSHELRTPLHAILGYAELLELDDRSEHDRDALMRIQTNGRQLLAMIDDLAALARGDDATADTTTLDVDDVVGEIVADLSTVASDRGLELRRGDAAGCSHGIEIGRLRQVARCMVIGAAQSMRSGTMVLDASAAATTPTVLRLVLASREPIGRDALVLPIAERLVAGRGSLTIELSDDASGATVTATFDPVA